ncbi:MAG: hypothetical protein IJH41_03145 [Eubacterium sp.]|nr:hypothetical protein [Eubacterium sp.]
MAYQTKKTEKGYRSFLADLKSGDIAPFVLLYGSEQFLVDWAVRALRDKYVNKATEVMDYQALDPDTDADSLIAAVQTLPMMSSRRVVVVRDLPVLSSAKGKGFSSDDTDRLTDLISRSKTESAAPEPSLFGGASLMSGEADPEGSLFGGAGGGTLCVLTSEEVDGRSKLVKALKKYGSVYDFDSLSTEELQAFAAKRFHAAGLKIGRQEMAFLIRETGYGNKDSEYRLFNFDNDIKKIIACTDGQYVTHEAIADTVIGDSDTFIFDLLDGISGNDKSRAFEILGSRLAKDQYEAMSVTGAICSQIEIMYQARELESRGRMTSAQIAEYTGQNEYRVRKALSYAKRYSLDKLRTMLENIYDVNKNIVSGLMEPRLALEMFIAEI